MKMLFLVQLYAVAPPKVRSDSYYTASNDVALVVKWRVHEIYNCTHK